MQKILLSYFVFLFIPFNAILIWATTNVMQFANSNDSHNIVSELQSNVQEKKTDSINKESQSKFNDVKYFARDNQQISAQPKNTPNIQRNNREISKRNKTDIPHKNITQEQKISPEAMANNEEIQQYIHTHSCKTKQTQICIIAIDLLTSLNILEKIQYNNLLLALQKKESNLSTKSLKKLQDNVRARQALQEKKRLNLHSVGDTGEEILDYHRLQSKEIVVVTSEEYGQLHESMLRFCEHFKTLKNYDRDILFSLTWHNNLLFKDEKAVKKFCKKKFDITKE
ncbi:hypothetical protein CQA53_05335 [Helicobacter didelphidarum]|uniref:Uncharacterized protein n=1 Tax=Helicobacter didelphidarum TaxID=2040648 RepID=A0A3D8ILP3_9HELI|nr:hypothetical protein [Helicobacter didelphidarum]RDU65875.1 hypothetical protein CQA53_05335 [Helicobacter didelphidarum]